MALSVTENARKLWDAWNIRGLIILSLSLQAFLILFAQLRRGRIGRKWFIRWPIWLAYLSADWVAIYTIGLIFSSNSSTSNSTSLGPPNDLLVFWASFLLLHLGGPDNITSYALEDNEFWKRHLFGLLLQVGSTLYVFLKSFSKNKLWLPTILVLFAGIMKFAERTFAFYCASFDHFGEDWVSINFKRGADKREAKMDVGSTRLAIPVQFHGMEDDKSILGTIVQLFGNLKRALLGPLLKRREQERIRRKFLTIERSLEVLRVLEIELSLLYETLHTKLPVIDSKSGFKSRMANLSCVLLAMLSFSLAKRHYQLVEFDMMLTYGLLIAALALNFLSIMFLVKHSDWFAVAHSQGQASQDIQMQHRWSNEVSQLHYITYHVKNMPVWLNKVAGFLHMRSLLDDIKKIICGSSRRFEFDPLWRFIRFELESFPRDTPINEVWFKRGKEILNEELQRTIDKLDYTQCLLVWHIATELCYQMDEYKPASRRTDYRSICKLLSDYMFYLAVIQPTMMATVLDNWSSVLKKISKQTQSVVPWRPFLNEKTASREILDWHGLQKEEEEEEDNDDEEEEREVEISLNYAVCVARCLVHDRNDRHNLWKEMSRSWIELMCYAAINCRPNVHAQQPSQGGELLTFVWLMMNHLGLGTIYYTALRDAIPSRETRESISEPED